jgi:hypothetical protein
LVFPPTYSSWLNWIEAEFTALRYFALNGTDHRAHAEQNAATTAYIRWHNTRARPKTGSATDSPIQSWTDYPAEGDCKTFGVTPDHGSAPDDRDDVRRGAR